MLESEVILSRYKAVERESDKLGRIIGVRRLKPSEQAKVSGMTAELTGYDKVEETGKDGQPTGRKVDLPHRIPLMIAASVCEIDSAPIPFPRSRAELDAVYDRLDNEGMEAATKAWVKLVETQVGIDTKDEAKN